MKLAPLYFYIINLVVHAGITIPFWFIKPEVNYIFLVTFILISIYGSTKEGEMFFNSPDTVDDYE